MGGALVVDGISQANCVNSHLVAVSIKGINDPTLSDWFFVEACKVPRKRQMVNDPPVLP